MNAPLHYNQDMLFQDTPDPDPTETLEWRDAFVSLLESAGPDRARQMLDELSNVALAYHLGWQPRLCTPYVNTIHVNEQQPFPGDLALEEKLAAIMRWNALAMVVKANNAYGELGGHIASYTSGADLFETGFNHFFHAREGLNEGEHRGDLVFLQPHSAPGVYARAFLEGRLDENDLNFYRREITAADHGAKGLSSYPHPMLMPDFWQFPTGSMGIGPISSIYQARFMRYLSHRGLLDCEGRKVWGMFGDGEMDEPESMSALTLAAREKLDNLIWIVNCNLQRLDGPVRGNGRIIDELERLFKGAGWNVIKLVWGSDWDGLFARDTEHALVQAFANTVDGQMQTFAAKDGAYNRDHFFGQNEALKRLAQGMTDEEIDRLKRGGHDLVKIHAAYAAAQAHKGQPTVILAQTKKGYGMGTAGQGRMTTHSQKVLEAEDLIAFRNHFKLPITDEQAVNLNYYKPEADSREMQYLHERRQALGGYLPARHTTTDAISLPELDKYAAFAMTPNNREMSTTMAFVRMLGNLLKQPELGPRIVPIVADEARTFGMAALFKQVGIYSSVGQRYSPEDIDTVLSYREATDGQILEEGISEAGALASWTAAATSYSVHGLTMLPFYIYYSMFGFQRVGDQIWAAADQRTRGFLVGATSGRTTLGGEGLQHQDGTSHLIAATIPNCKAYDPAFAGELAIIVDQGMREMIQEEQDVFYYVTVMNENYAQPDIDMKHRDGILKGAYLFEQLQPENAQKMDEPIVTLMASGAILNETRKAARQLQAQGYSVDLISVTSWSELSRHHKDWLQSLIDNGTGPIVAVSDYVCAVPEAIRQHIPSSRSLTTLGTDGYGRSDTRDALRGFFGISEQHIVNAACART
ncbi:pyruvate dehydrogenase (acetyl-transferring), homodimeric type [Orrella sp. 11846]|uniref:pyruvate dehydrogenase (acetyl-transferring), homodimeric type n=1 Tax=Orrella sp. 11846 TaxID=3409913 RepID=UPI003B5B167C